MQTTAITMDAALAREHYEAYLRDRHYDTPEDLEIRRIYRALAQGKTVIKALESIVAAGVDADGLPKLAIMRADQKACACQRDRHGGFRLMQHRLRHRPSSAADLSFEFPAGSLPAMPDPRSLRGWWDTYEAPVPLIPKALRPRRALQRYHVLWEVEKWERSHVPTDPFLLRRLGKADAWLVVAAWDLTEVERTVLQSRISVN